MKNHTSSKRLILRLKIGLTVIAGFLSLGLTGCTGPRMHEDLNIKQWVLLQCIDREDLVDEYLSDIYLGEITIPGIENDAGLDADKPRSFSEACMLVFECCIKDITKYKNNKQFREQYIDQWNNFYNQQKGDSYWWLKEETAASIRLCRNDQKRAQKLLLALFDGFMDYCAYYADQDITVLNWDYENSSQGDSYTGYLVTYEIEKGYYALIHLIEFDDDRYSMKLIYQGSSFSTLLEYIE